MIRILHVTEDHSTRNYGVSAAVDAMTRCVPDHIRPEIACVGIDTLPLRQGITVHAFPTQGAAKFWRYAPGAYSDLHQAIENADVVHIHGLWMWIQWSAARAAVRLHKPFVLTPHGMLEPWIWQRQSWPNRLKKYLYWNGLAYPTFQYVNTVHALTTLEAATLCTYFPEKTPLVIPHSIDLQAVDSTLQALPPPVDEPPYFLFVGRLHPVKGIHLLIQAFARLSGDRFHLKIAGPTQPQEQAYADSLVQLVRDLGLENRVSFLGYIRGADKWQLYRDAWVFCLPSFSEVIGMVNLEAAACGVPVITSFETGVVDDWDRCGGIRVHPEEASVLAGLQQAAAWTLPERRSNGVAMRELVETNYSWATVGSQWASLYERLAGGSNHNG